MIKPIRIKIYVFEALQVCLFLISSFYKTELISLNQTSEMMYEEDT